MAQTGVDMSQPNVSVALQPPPEANVAYSNPQDALLHAQVLQQAEGELCYH